MFTVLGVSSVHHPERVLGEFGERGEAIERASEVVTSELEAFEMIVVVDERDEVVWSAREETVL